MIYSDKLLARIERAANAVLCRAFDDRDWALAKKHARTAAHAYRTVRLFRRGRR